MKNLTKYQLIQDGDRYLIQRESSLFGYKFWWPVFNSSDWRDAQHAFERIKMRAERNRIIEEIEIEE